MKHDDLRLDTLNTPIEEVRLIKCTHCKGQKSQGYYCELAKKQVCKMYPCSPMYQLICPRAIAHNELNHMYM